MDSLLKTIKASLEGVKFDLDNELDQSRDGISLLALKNESMLAYMHSLVLVISGMLERSQQPESQQEKNTELLNKAILGTVTHRAVLEKGVKGLETKMQYQIEKVLRAYMKARQDTENAVNTDTIKKQSSSSSSATKKDDIELDSDDEALSFKPNPKALSSSNDRGDPESSKQRSSASGNSTDKYVAPKLSAVTPSFAGSDKPQRVKKNVTMEEYLQEASGAPSVEPSIGSTIMDGGRGGSSTEVDRRKQKAIQKYEEENYTRLPGLSSKQQRREARQRQLDANEKNLFGEDWRFLDNIAKDDKRPATKKRKTMSAWERAKKNSSM